MPTPPDGASPAPGTGVDPKGVDNTPLQSHVAFFDPDSDGIIWPLDTFRGFRDLGFGYFISILSMIAIHGGFSWVTFGTLLPDPFFRLKIKYMHRGKHGSDSEIYTSKGEFDKQRFDDIFNSYTSPPHTHMSFWEGAKMIRGNRNMFDPFGWAAAMLEWLATYLLIWPKDGKVKRQDIQDVYDGSLFYKKSRSGKKMPRNTSK